MRAIWHFTIEQARLESDSAALIHLQRNQEGIKEAVHEQIIWHVLDNGFWEPSTIILRNGTAYAVLSRPIGNGRAVLTIVDGDRYHFKLIQGPSPRLSLVNGMGREVMVQRALGIDLASAELRIHRERVPRGDLVPLILMAGHAFHGLMCERNRELTGV